MHVCAYTRERTHTCILHSLAWQATIRESAYALQDNEDIARALIILSAA